MRLVLRRLRGARSLLAAAVVATLLAVSFVVGLLAYGQQVVGAAARATVAAAPPQERALLVRGSANAGGTDLATKDAALRSALADGIGGRPVSVAAAGYSVGREFSGPTGDAVGDTDGVVYANVMFLDALADHARLVDGAWARPGQATTEATLAAAAASVLQLSVGDTVPVTDRLTGAVTSLAVTGIWEPIDPADPYWSLAPAVTIGVAPGGHTYGPLAVDRADFARDWTGSASVAWVVQPDLTGAGLAELRQLAAALPGLSALPATAGLGEGALVSTTMDRLADRLAHADLVGRSALLTPVLLIVVLGLYALLLVAALLTEHRRAETALIRARGAGRLQIAGFGLRESVLLVLPAALLAPPVAAWALRLAGQLRVFTDIAVDLDTPATASMWIVASVAAVACLVAIVAPSVRRSGTYLEELSSRSRPGRYALAQRVGLDVALVILAVLAWFQLRQYASPLTGAGGTLGIDPVLVAAPTVGVLAGAVLSLRLLPWLTRLIERWLNRRHHLAALFGMWQAGRRPHAGPVLLVALAVAVSTLAWSMLSTAQRSLVDQADFAVGADVRVVEANGFAPEDRAAQLAAVPGVRTVAPVYRTVLTLGAESTSTDLLAIDPDLAAQVVHYRADLGGGPDAFARLVAARPAESVLTLPAGATRFAATVQVAGTLDESSVFNPFQPRGPDELQLAFTAVLLTADGHLVRLPLGTVTANQPASRFDVALPADPGLALVRLNASIPGPTAATLTWQLTDVQVADAAGAWSALDLTQPPAWTAASPVGYYVAATGDAAGVSGTWRFEDIRQSGPTAFWIRPSAGGIEDLPVLATPAAAAALRVDDDGYAPASIAGVPVRLHVVGEVAAVPGTSHSPAALVADLRSLAVILGGTRSTGATIAEHWVAVDPGASAEVVTRLAGVTGVSVLDRVDEATVASREPYGVGGRAGLFAAGAGALLLALIGIGVDIRATARRRVGEFAVLQTLGAGSRLLARSVLAEQGFLAGLGVLVGLGVGIGVAATLAPLLILTPSADRPEPTALLSVPWLPVLGTAAALLAAALLISGLVAASLGRRLAVARLRIGDEV